MEFRDLRYDSIAYIYENNYFTPKRGIIKGKIKRKALMKAIDNGEHYRGTQLYG